MRHLYIRRNRDHSIMAEVEADEQTYQSIRKGMLRCEYPPDNCYVDASEFKPCRITDKQSENGFLYLLCAVVFVAFILWLLGGGC